MYKKDDIITLQHGSGGEFTTKLLNQLVFNHLGNPILDQKHDGALLNVTQRLAFSTDSFVISPIFFKGGDIGELAVNGTVNDLAMCGATPKYLSLSFILEEGLLISDFEKIIISIKKATKKSGVQIVTGDTKVVERGKGDKIYINTSGIGEIHKNANININRINKGDAIVLNANIASHGMAILSQREGLSFTSDLKSDTKNLNASVTKLLDDFGKDVHFLRDATRGGLASVLNEIVSDNAWGVHLFEEKIKVESSVKNACELFGLDPLYVANEGVFISIVNKNIAQELVKTLQKDNNNASIIGTITTEHSSKVVLESAFGGKRIVNPMVGEQLPRIC